MKSTIRLGKIAGIPIGIHYSWFAVLVFFSWSLATRLLPSLNGGWSTATYWAIGVVAALLLFVSVLIHELAHSVVARARGFPVEGITLFLLGGVSSLKAEARGPRDEFIIAAVGPAASLVLAGLLLLAYRVIGGNELPLWLWQVETTRLTPFESVLFYLWFINLVLAIFNLLPAFPLDGGRVLRSVVWGATGSLSRATKVASRGGQVMGILLIAVGVLEIFNRNMWGGMWLAFIGWFLYSTAGATQRESEAQASLRGMLVRDVMDRDPETVGPEVSLADIVFGPLLHKGARALPVCEDGHLIGIITLTDVKGVPQHRWREARVRDEMTPMPLWSVTPEDELAQGLQLLAEHSVNQAPVVEGVRLVGLLTRADITQQLHSRRELGLGPER